MSTCGPAYPTGTDVIVELSGVLLSRTRFCPLALKMLGEQAKAITPLRQGLEHSPADFELQLALGEALLDTGNFAEAEKHLREAADVVPPGGDRRLDEALKRLSRKKDK